MTDMKSHKGSSGGLTYFSQMQKYFSQIHKCILFVDRILADMKSHENFSVAEIFVSNAEVFLSNAEIFLSNTQMYFVC